MTTSNLGQNDELDLIKSLQALSLKSPDVESEDSQLISSLQALSVKSPKLVRSTPHPAPADPNITIRSWKMNEFKYSDQPCPFPTLARGLFTDWQESTPGHGRFRIVARGYDKFFNIGEVKFTAWPAIEANTKAPYVMTLKSNGCIIFIAALSPTQLLVTSKHSLGAINGVPMSHAQMGELWLEKHLTSKGKTKADLAERLWKEGLTAVSELCDDNFEEHVLPYPPHLSGLHLHGLNLNTGNFHTLPSADVASFAREWGFIETPTISLPSIAAVREFADKAAETGSWNGEPVEGFVVRTTVADVPTGATPPYAPGADFFFKIKFEEPYLMYRDWREITRTILSSNSKSKPANIPKGKLRRAESRVYRRWVEREIQRDPDAFEGFGKGKGIIAIRDRFLEWCETDAGKAELTKEKGGKGVDDVGGSDVTKTWEKTIIVPVAVPGCGKTAVGVALSHLFGWGHTQSDDVKSKKSGPAFTRNVVDLLKNHEVVYADRNNHLSMHRVGLREAAEKIQGTSVGLVALNWSFDLPMSTIHRIAGDRVAARGTNHQTLTADDTKSYEEVIWMFLDQAEELGAGEVDAVIKMDIEDDLETAVKRAVDELVPLLGLEEPDDESLKEACHIARGYKPSTLRAEDKKAKKVTAQYFGILAEVDLTKLLDKAFEREDTPKKIKDSWNRLKEARRVARRPHVTIVHRKSLPAERFLWDQCVDLQKLTVSPLLEFKVGRVVCDDRVMALTVESVRDVKDTPEGKTFLDGLPDLLKSRLHITVGTRDRNVSAVEGKTLVEAWRKGEHFLAMELQETLVYGTVKGLS